MPASEQTEPLVKDLPEKWLREQADYPDSPEGQHAAAAVRTNAAELNAAIIRERDACLAVGRSVHMFKGGQCVGCLIDEQFFVEQPPGTER